MSSDGWLCGKVPFWKICRVLLRRAKDDWCDNYVTVAGDLAICHCDWSGTFLLCLFIMVTTVVFYFIFSALMGLIASTIIATCAVWILAFGIVASHSYLLMKIINCSFYTSKVEVWQDLKFNLGNYIVFEYCFLGEQNV